MVPSAIQARQQGSITQEIAIISLRILDAISSNQLSTTVSDTTTVVINGVTITGSIMTAADATGAEYYDVWQNRSTDTVKLAQMTEVLDYFSRQGYNIRRISTTGTEFFWSISW